MSYFNYLPYYFIYVINHFFFLQFYVIDTFKWFLLLFINRAIVLNGLCDFTFVEALVYFSRKY
jgi:hypothetical protein